MDSETETLAALALACSLAIGGFNAAIAEANEALAAPIEKALDERRRASQLRLEFIALLNAIPKPDRWKVLAQLRSEGVDLAPVGNAWLGGCCTDIDHRDPAPLPEPFGLVVEGAVAFLLCQKAVTLQQETQEQRRRQQREERRQGREKVAEERARRAPGAARGVGSGPATPRRYVRDET